jgi:hypothetical protein
MVRSTSGGIAVGPGANRYLFCIVYLLGLYNVNCVLLQNVIGKVKEIYAIVRVHHERMIS